MLVVDKSGRQCNACGVKQDDKPTKWRRDFEFKGEDVEEWLCKKCYDLQYRSIRIPIIHANTLCVICNGKTTSNWTKHGGGHACRKCIGKIQRGAPDPRWREKKRLRDAERHARNRAQWLIDNADRECCECGRKHGEFNGKWGRCGDSGWYCCPCRNRVWRLKTKALKELEEK